MMSFGIHFLWSISLLCFDAEKIKEKKENDAFGVFCFP
jgi:hypothetical protein